MKVSDDILFVATNEELANIARQVALEMGLSLEVVMGNPLTAVEIAHEANARGFTVIVSRGTTARLMDRCGLPAPVVKVRVTGYDAVRALIKAKRYTDHVGIVGSDDMIRWVGSLDGVLGGKVSTRVAESWDDTCEAITSLRDGGVGAIVGWNLVQRRAAEVGLPFVPLSSGKEAVYDALNEAMAVAKARHSEAERAERLKAILSSVTNAVVAVDSSGKVTHFNQAAERMVGISSEEAIGTHLSTILGSHQTGAELLDLESRGEWIDRIGHLTVLARREPIVVDGAFVGAVLSLDDVTRIRELERIVREEVRDTGHTSKHRLNDVVGVSDAIREAVNLAARFAQVDSTVLIQGETGTGKELFAHGIHSESARQNGPFVAVNCAAIPETLLESELFGYAPGAFTGARQSGKPGLFEIAHMGTIFLDEIGEMSKPLQARLLRVLQERQTMRVGGTRVIPIDVRIIAATNKHLFSLVQQGAFRDDLFYRLSVLNLEIPPLRRRPEDIPVLAVHLMRSVAARLQRPARTFTPDALDRLASYSWPGNVRQLENTIEQLVAVGQERQPIKAAEVDKILSRYALATDTSSSGASTLVAGAKAACEATANEHAPAGLSGRASPSHPGETPSLPDLRTLETRAILTALAAAGGNKAAAARALGISKTTLWRRLKRLQACGLLTNSTRALN